jgi:autotransporter-associated beta strand protein
LLAGSTAGFNFATNTGGYHFIEILGPSPAIVVGAMNITMTGTTGLTIRGSLADGGARAGVLIFDNNGAMAQLNIVTLASTAPTTFSDVNGLRMQLDSNINVAIYGAPAIFDLPVSGVGRLIKIGTGQLNLEGPVTTSGGITILEGVLQAYGVSGPLGSGDIQLANGGTLRASGTISNTIATSGAVLGSGGSGQLVSGNSLTLTLTGMIQHLSGGTFSFGSATDNGTIIASTGIANVNNNGGGYQVAGGILRMGNAFNAANLLSLHSSGTVEISAGATLDSGGFATTVRNLLIDGGTIRASIGTLNLTVNDINPGISFAQTGTIEGTDGADQVTINVLFDDSFSLVTLLNWSAGTDTITFNGSLNNNIIQGTAGSDTINGFDGNDTLFSSGGIDTINGGNGDDSIAFSSNNLGSFIDGGAGIDTLYLEGGNYVLGSIAGFEAVVLAAVNLQLTGAQFSTGLSSSSTLSGTGHIVINMAPGDLIFATGMNVLAGSNITLEIFGSTDVDVIKGNLNTVNEISGGDSTDQIRGGGLADTINGGNGNDKIMSLGGADVLFGGAGADQFRYLFTTDSGTGAAADLILDFVSGSDKLDFRSLDADPFTAGRQQLTYIGTSNFVANGIAQVRYSDLGSDLRVYVDLDGNGVSDMEMLLSGAGAGTLQVTDFLF